MSQHRLAIRAVCAALATNAACGTWMARAADGDPCAIARQARDAIAAVGPGGRLTLASGRTVVLWGIRLSDDAILAQAAAQWLWARRDKPVMIAERSSPDRWGQIAVDASDASGDLAGGLIEQGLAVVDAGESDRLCRADLLPFEHDPRQERRGMWAGNLADPADGVALAQREGDFVVAEGRIVSVSDKGKRVYLNFTKRWQTGLSAALSKRSWKRVTDRGYTAETLRGREVRVRGTIEVWRGPILDGISPDVIEVLDDANGARH